MKSLTTVLGMQGLISSDNNRTNIIKIISADEMNNKRVDLTIIRGISRLMHEMSNRNVYRKMFIK